MAKEKKAVLVYHDFYEHLRDLSFEDKGKIFDAILEYDMTGSVSIELSPVLNMAFKFIKAAIDRDKDAYDKRCVKNSQNGLKGGRPSRENADSSKNNRMVLDETEQNSNKPKKPNGYFENPNNQTVNLKTEKTERLNQKPKKADNDTDNDNENDIDNDPLPIEGVKGEEGSLFSFFLKRVKGKIPDEHIENCFISLSENLKNEAGILKCTDDWILTVFNKNEKTHFPAKSLVEYARANIQKYKAQPKTTPDVTKTQEYLEKNRQIAKNSVSPSNFSKDEALSWLKNLPAFWRGKSKIARDLINKYGFSENDYEQPENQ